MQNLEDEKGGVEYFEEGLKKGKKFHAWARLGIGACYIMSEDYIRADIEFEQACKLDPKNSIAWYESGRAKYDLRSITSARDCFLKATDLDQKFGKAWLYLGDTWDKLKEFQKAIDAFKRVPELDSKNVDALRRLGNAYYHLTDYTQAIQCYEQVLQYEPKNDYAWNMIGAARFFLEDFAGAEQAYRKALEFNKQNATALYNLAEVCLKQGRVPEATKIYEESLLKDARQNTAWCDLAKIYEQAGRSGEAAYCWQWVFRLEEDPKQKAALEPRGWPEGIVAVKPQFLRGAEPDHWDDLLELAGAMQGNHKWYDLETKALAEFTKEDKYKRFSESPVLIEQGLLDFKPNTPIWEEALATHDPNPPRSVMACVLWDYVENLRISRAISTLGNRIGKWKCNVTHKALWEIAEQYLPVLEWIVTGSTKEEWERALANVGNSSGDAEAFRNKVVLARRSLLQLADAYWDFDADEILRPILDWFEKAAPVK